jgi:hypothetical protein
MTLLLSGTSGLSDVDGSAATPAIRGTDANTGIFFPAADTIAFSEGGTEAMRIDSSGNVGIGTAVAGAISPSLRLGNSGSGGGVVTATLSLGSYSTGYGSNIISSSDFSSSSASYLAFGTTATGASGLSAPVERMRIDSSGNLLVGTTSLVSAGKIEIAATAATNQGLNIKDTAGSNNLTYCALFNSSGTVAGTITHTGSTTVAYNTSSDYRLKENIAPMTGALNTVAQLKPVTYKWKEDQTAGQGFIAHELQAVVPDCVTGAKDALDEDGKPVYQGIDVSFLVATLTAAIQEQQALITILTDRITALEAKP